MIYICLFNIFTRREHARLYFDTKLINGMVSFNILQISVTVLPLPTLITNQMRSGIRYQRVLYIWEFFNNYNILVSDTAVPEKIVLERKALKIRLKIL